MLPIIDLRRRSAEADGPAPRRHEVGTLTKSCAINLSLARRSSGLVAALAGDGQHPFGNPATALWASLSETRMKRPRSTSHPRLGETRPHFGPWLCAPALRLVCLFEDERRNRPFTHQRNCPSPRARGGDLETGRERSSFRRAAVALTTGLRLKPMSEAADVKSPT